LGSGNISVPIRTVLSARQLFGNGDLKNMLSFRWLAMAVRSVYQIKVELTHPSASAKVLNTLV
jgi:hypothetical protein